MILFNIALFSVLYIYQMIGSWLY